MANREENIKKINDALEQLSDEELDQVAGGIRDETLAYCDTLGKRLEQLSDDNICHASLG